MDSDYYPRIIDTELKDLLDSVGAIEIIGPKWVGKTTSAKRIAKSVVDLQDEDIRKIAEEVPARILSGDNPRLLDEWQEVPRLWDAVRRTVDERNSLGLFILTGSVKIDRSAIHHSGAGRIISTRMRTMTLFEMRISDGSVPLSSLFRGGDVSGKSTLTLEDLARTIVRGGWPGTIKMSDQAVHRVIKGYCNTLIQTEVRLIDGKRRDPEKMGRILRSLSRNVCSSISNMKLLSDIRDEEDYSMGINTLTDYLSALRSVSLIEDMPSWNPKLRSSAITRTSPTRYMCDPAVCAYFLGASASDLLDDFTTFGLLFECLAVRDLRVYAQALGGTVCHYRDSNDCEVDCIVHLDNGDWGAVEIKLTGHGIDSAVKSLDKFRNTLADKTLAHMKFRAILIGCYSDAYQRRDGIYVVPISCLRNRCPYGLVIRYSMASPASVRPKIPGIVGREPSTLLPCSSLSDGLTGTVSVE